MAEQKALTAQSAIEAKADGVPDDVIVKWFYDNQDLVSLGDKAFDVRAAKDDGVPDSEIVNFLVRGRGFDRSDDPVQAFGRGVASGTAQILGLPVDAGVAVFNKMRQAAPETSAFAEAKPAPQIDPSAVFGGTESIKRGMGALGQRTYGTLQDLPPEERVMATAGEVFGGGAPISAAPIGLAKLGVKGPKLLEPIMNLAKNSPWRFAAVEATGLAGSAQLAAGAEFMFPGDSGVRLGAEVVGGFMNPAGLVLRGGKAATQFLKDIALSFTRGGREDKVSKLLQSALAENKEDLVEVARKLRQKELPGVVLTSGQKSGSKTLLAMEHFLAKENAKFGGEAATRVKETFEAFRDITDTLASQGTPEALRAAARVRQQYFGGIISARISQAQADSALAWGRVGKGELSGKKAYAVLDEAMQQIRGVESELWDKIPKETPLRPVGTIKAYDDLRATMLKSESVDPIAEAEISRLRPKKKEAGGLLDASGKPISRVEFEEPAASAGDLLRLRSRMLKLARDARGGGLPDKARQYTAIADGALDDLSKLPGDAADQARAFTKELNDYFSRTFAGDALGLEKTGALRIDPELLLETAFGRGGTAGDIKLMELAEAAGFTGKQAKLELAARIRGQAMLSEQEKFLKAAADATTDTGGRVNPQRLQDFVEKNEAVFARFPELRQNLMNAAEAEKTFRDVEKLAVVQRNAVQNKTAFGMILGWENMSEGIKEVLSSKKPEINYSQLVRVAKRHGPEAMDGLKVATLEYATRQSIDASGAFSFSKYHEVMTKPIGKSPGVLDIMERQGILNRRDATLVRRVITRAKEIEEGLRDPSRVNQILSETDGLTDLAIRIIGSHMGGAPAKILGIQTGPAGLVQAGAGVRFFRKLMEKIPNTRLSGVIEEVARNQEFAAALIEKPRTVKRARELEKQINGFLVQAGLTPEIEEEEPPKPAPKRALPYESAPVQ